MDVNKNFFINTAYELFYTLEQMSDILRHFAYPDISENATNNIFRNIFKKSEPDSAKNAILSNTEENFSGQIRAVNDLYGNALKNIRNTNSADFSIVVKHYIAFIKMAEKVFMYVNDMDTSNIYADIDNQLEKYYLYIDNDDYKIRFTIQDSEINMPGTEEIPGDDDYIGFMRPENTSRSKTVIFIDIDVERLYGSKMTSNYKFIYSSSLYQENDVSDTVLLKVINNITSKVIYNHFKNILLNVIPKVSRIDDSKWKDEVLKMFDFCSEED